MTWFWAARKLLSAGSRRRTQSSRTKRSRRPLPKRKTTFRVRTTEESVDTSGISGELVEVDSVVVPDNVGDIAQAWLSRSRKPEKHPLVLARLSAEQIHSAKSKNGKRKQITHAIICGPYGQVFGTEKQCRKYFDAWSSKSGPRGKLMFSNLFSYAHTTDYYPVAEFESTFNLVNILILMGEIADQI